MTALRNPRGNSQVYRLNEDKMKELVIYVLFCVTLLSGSALYAQKPVEPKSEPAASAILSARRDMKTEDKREELSKKLLERKNELRREEKEHAKEIRSVEVREKHTEIKR